MTDGTPDQSVPPDASHIHPSMRVYRDTPEMASEYDDFYSGTALLEHDTDYLDAQFTEPGPLLDLGCGVGRHVLHFAWRKFDVTGIDFSEHMIRETQKRLVLYNLSATLVCADMFDLARLGDESFQYCICMFSVLGLIRGYRNRVTFVRRIGRVLRPGGLFAFHVHNRLFNFCLPDGRRWLLYTYTRGLLHGLEVGDKIMDGYRNIPNMYLHIFSAREIRKLLRDAGLDIVDICYLNTRRTGPLQGRLFRSWRANGFLVTAGK